MNPFGQASVDRLSVARSRETRPSGALIWRLNVSAQLVEACGDEWSQPVQFKFERLPDGRLDMLVRTISEERA